MDLVELAFEKGENILRSYLSTNFLVTMMEQKREQRPHLKSIMGKMTSIHCVEILNLYRELDIFIMLWMTQKLVKFSNLGINEDPIEFQYDKAFEKHNSLKIAASENSIELLLELSKLINPPYYILYVLVKNRTQNKAGRYQSPQFDSHTEIKKFLTKYSDFLTSDGRHHIWVGTVAKAGTLVYDQHNVIFAYGPLEKYERKLLDIGYTEKRFQFPEPDCHYYHDKNDKFERKILNEFDWERYPLLDIDEYEE